MEDESSSEKTASSYRYWVRGVSSDAVPLPQPMKVQQQQQDHQKKPTLGSAWNQAGTWEEKNLTSWASLKIKELVMSIGSLDLPNGGKAQISNVSKCVGDAFLVTVRNKKRVGYTYELTLNVKVEWISNSSSDEKKEKLVVNGHIDIPEFSFGEIEDLQVEVRLSEQDIKEKEKPLITQHLVQLFLPTLRQKLVDFEQLLKHRD